MWRVSRRTKQLAAGLCERCVCVQDRRCRAVELARQAYDQMLYRGWRLA